MARRRRGWGRARLAALALALVCGVSTPTAALPAVRERVDACLAAAAAHHGVELRLLRAIAFVESGFDPRAVNRANRNGSRDIGLMQINSGWLPRLARFGIAEDDLFEPCVSAHVGAWVLAGNIRRLGATWRAVGAYNAVTPSRQAAYVARVQAALRTLSGGR